MAMEIVKLARLLRRILAQYQANPFPNIYEDSVQRSRVLGAIQQLFPVVGNHPLLLAFAAYPTVPASLGLQALMRYSILGEPPGGEDPEDPDPDPEDPPDPDPDPLPDPEPSTLTFKQHNAGAQTLAAGVTTFAQTFAEGFLQPTDILAATVGEEDAIPVQFDAKTFHGDGSVKHALCAVERPSLTAGAEVEAELGVTTGDYAAALALAAGLSGHTFEVTITPDGGSPTTYDVFDLLLAEGSPDYWRQGPFVTEARLTINLDRAMRLIFDVSVYKGGGVAIEVIPANDRAYVVTGGKWEYTFTAELDGNEVVNETIINHSQYQRWHRRVATNTTDGSQDIGFGTTAGWLNLKHNITYQIEQAVFPAYAVGQAVAESLLAGYATRYGQTGWNTPLKNYGGPLVTNNYNDILFYMPNSGGRTDLGPNPGGAVAFLISQDARAGRYMLGQAEAGNSAPWHYWDDVNGRWCNRADRPILWLDNRGGSSGTTGLTQQPLLGTEHGWNIDGAHSPEVSYAVYALFGHRWALDNLQAEASWLYGSASPGVRDATGALVLHKFQPRGVSWRARSIDNAGWISPDGDFFGEWCRDISGANYAAWGALIDGYKPNMGEWFGIFPGDGSDYKRIAPWQYEYFIFQVILAAKRGNTDALGLLTYDRMLNFFVGRFEQGVPIARMGITYLMTTGPDPGTTGFETWEEVYSATVANNYGNVAPSWSGSGGEYPRLGLGTLANLHDLFPDDDRIWEAYRTVIGQNPPNISFATYAVVPAYFCIIPEIHNAWAAGTALPEPP